MSGGLGISDFCQLAAEGVLAILSQNAFAGFIARNIAQNQRLPQIMAHASLERIVDLPWDWDGYGASPVDPDVIAAASTFINDFGGEFYSAPSVVPMTHGRLQFEWQNGKRSLEVEFENPNVIHYLKWDPTRSIEDEAVVPAGDRDTINSLLRWLSSEKRNAEP